MIEPRRETTLAGCDLRAGVRARPVDLRAAGRLVVDLLAALRVMSVVSDHAPAP
jgi:hypothetical protein